MEKISAVYKIVNEVTWDSYVGSSRDVKQRWRAHKSPAMWKRQPNSLMYQDMQKYGLDKFRFQILAPVMPEYLTQVEQEFIEMLRPTYNNYMAKGRDVERRKESSRKYHQSDKGKETHRKSNHKRYSQMCFYNGKTLTRAALATRFRRAGIPHAYIESKKYLIES